MLSEKYLAYNFTALFTGYFTNLRYPETPVIQGKKQDHIIPYFARGFGTPHSYVCVDGNKRLQIRSAEGQTEFERYAFYPEHYQTMFISGVDLNYYILMYETSLMVG